jgi:hypothetical protein
VLLPRNLADQACPQVSRDTLGGVGLNHALQIGQDEDPERDDEELAGDGGEDELLPDVAVDGVRDDPRHQQVQCVGENRQRHEGRDQPAIRLHQAEQPRSARRGSVLHIGSVRHGDRPRWYDITAKIVRFSITIASLVVIRRFE